MRDIHIVDRLAPTVFRLTPRRTTVFRDGWGDEAGLGLLTDAKAPDVAGVPQIVWSRKEEHRGHRLTRGRFTSPLIDELPTEAGMVTVDLVEPGRGTDRAVVLLPAWNDHGPESRKQLAIQLLAHDIASVIFDAPYLGSRRVYPMSDQAIATVADFGRMGAGVVSEAVALVLALSDRWALGVSGYSMGGNLAALTAAVSPVPVAVAPLAASYSPGPVFCDAIMSRAVAWKALEADGGRERLRAVLGSTSVLDFPPPAAASSAVFVAGRSDGFVPPDLTRRLVEHWPGSELRLTDDGHATLLWRRRSFLAQAIADAFDRFAATT